MTRSWAGVQNLTERCHQENPQRCSRALRGVTRFGVRAAEPRAATSHLESSGPQFAAKSAFRSRSPIGQKTKLWSGGLQLKHGDAMKKFLALYMADTAQMADMMKNSTPEQRKKGSEAWMKWMDNNKASLADRGCPVGKTKRIDAKGTKDAENDVCGYSIVQAEFGGRCGQNLWERSAVLANARREDRHDRNFRDAGDIAADPSRKREGARTWPLPFPNLKTTAGASASSTLESQCVCPGRYDDRRFLVEVSSQAVRPGRKG